MKLFSFSNSSNSSNSSSPSTPHPTVNASKLIGKIKTALFDRTRKPGLIWLIPILLAGVMALFWDQAPAPTTSDTHHSAAPDTADTYIPAGYVLVPIEVANYESLDSILGQFGIVDLYETATVAERRPAKIAEKLKILRAPLNPSHFAVLVREDESPQLVAQPGPYTVVILNPKNIGTGIADPRTASRSAATGAATDQSEGEPLAGHVRNPQRNRNSLIGGTEKHSRTHRSGRIEVEMNDAETKND